MLNPGPIVLIEDDEEDLILLKEALEHLKVNNELRTFTNGQDALEYLLVMTEQPFLILCDINMPRMTGLQLRDRINDDAYLRRKSIPFVFMSTSKNPSEVDHAYQLTVQGYFQKTGNFKVFVNSLNCIISYWQTCIHPNSL